MMRNDPPKKDTKNIITKFPDDDDEEEDEMAEVASIEGDG